MAGNAAGHHIFLSHSTGMSYIGRFHVRLDYQIGHVNDEVDPPGLNIGIEEVMETGEDIIKLFIRGRVYPAAVGNMQDTPLFVEFRYINILPVHSLRSNAFIAGHLPFPVIGRFGRDFSR